MELCPRVTHECCFIQIEAVQLHEELLLEKDLKDICKGTWRRKDLVGYGAKAGRWDYCRWEILVGMGI